MSEYDWKYEFKLKACGATAFPRGVLTMSDRWNPTREKVMEGLNKVWDAFDHMEHELYADYVFDASKMLMESASIEEFKAWIGEIMLNTDNEPIEPSEIIRRIDEGGLKRFIEDYERKRQDE